MFGNTISAFAGVKIFQSELAMQPGGPVRVHRKRRNQTAAYHNRISKKWLKRFGRLMVPGIYQTAMGLIVHPALMPRLREAMNRPAAQEAGGQ